MSKIEINVYLEKINLLIEESSLIRLLIIVLPVKTILKMILLYQYLGRIFLETENYQEHWMYTHG